MAKDAGAPASSPVRRAGRRRWLRDRPASVQAPLLLFSFPGILLAVAASCAILAGITAAGPVFASSAEDAAFHQQLEPISRWQAGLRVDTLGVLYGQVFATGSLNPFPASALVGLRDGPSTGRRRNCQGSAPRCSPSRAT